MYVIPGRHMHSVNQPRIRTGNIQCDLPGFQGQNRFIKYQPLSYRDLYL